MTPPTVQHSPAAERNRGPIGEQLQAWLPPAGQALELACGTGQHAGWFGPLLPGWHWQPTDANPALFDTVRHWCAGQPNVAPPQVLDLLAPECSAWPAPASLDLVYVANLTHISPWPASEALFRLAASALKPEGQLVIYGPFIIEGEPLADSNAAFDADLRRRDPAWGLRVLGALIQAAAAQGLALVRRQPMPANNQLLCWQATTAAWPGS